MICSPARAAQCLSWAFVVCVWSFAVAAQEFNPGIDEGDEPISILPEAATQSVAEEPIQAPLRPDAGDDQEAPSSEELTQLNPAAIGLLDEDVMLPTFPKPVNNRCRHS